MIQNCDTVKFINIAPGLFDDTMKCSKCGFVYENRADSSYEENKTNSTHKCKVIRTGE